MSMVLLDFNIDGMMYADMLTISNLDDLKIYHNIKQKRCENDYGNVLTTHLSDSGRDSLYETAVHYANEGVVKVAAFSGGNAIDVELKMHNLLSGQYRFQALKIIEGNIIVINAKGGYHWRKLEDIEIVNEVELTIDNIYKFINGTNNKETKIYSHTDNYFVIDKKGNIYQKECICRHDTICNIYNLNVDKVVKLMYYRSDSRTHKLFNEFGIQGLRLSAVYEHVLEPFTIKESHLKSIEKFILKIEKK